MSVKYLPDGWIVLHDAENASPKKGFAGTEYAVNPKNVGVVRGYQDSRAGATLWINGSYLHVTEDRDTVLLMISEKLDG